MKVPICVGVHAVFADNTYKDLINAGARGVITCNSIVHESNGIDINDLLVNVLKDK